MRKVLFTILATAAVGLCGAVEEKIFNVKDYGAVGNGIADDSRSIRESVNKLKQAGGGKIYFPAGNYLCKAKGNIIDIKGTSNITIEFEPSAKLLIDNLREDGRGNGHGIRIAGPASNIKLKNINIDWLQRPKHRSHGDGIRFDGFPEDNKTLSHILLLNVTVTNTPQAGTIFHGCSDITVKNFRSEKTLADGLHFNACRNVDIDRVHGIENGDDSLAFVTYYSKEHIGAYGNNNPPYAQPSVGDWSNTNIIAKNIAAIGGRACGVRISGGNNINLSLLKVTNKSYGIQIDAARKTTENRAVGWSYQASKNIIATDLLFSQCDNGILMRTLNLDIDDPVEDWKPDNIVFRNVTISECKNGVIVRDTANVSLSEISSDSPVKIINTRGTVNMSHLSIKNSYLDLSGTQSGKVQKWTRSREAQPFVATSALDNLVPGKLSIKDVVIDGGRLFIRNSAGVTMENFTFKHPKEQTIELEKVLSCKLSNFNFVSSEQSIDTFIKIGIHRNVTRLNWKIVNK